MNLLEIALGIVTGIGGFLEVGSIATSADAGASFRFQLIWSLVLATVCLCFLVEMSGRLAAISRHTLADAVRERFGFPFTVVPRLMELLVNFAVLAAELGGVGMAIKLVTGWPIQATAIPIALVAWFLVWVGTLKIVENGTAILGLVSLCFVVAAWRLHPPVLEVARGLVPSLPRHEPSHYWFIAISIVGATIAPYMFHFYSSGAIEDKWSEKDLLTNKVSATAGMVFGAVLAIAVMIVAGGVFAPRGIAVDHYEQIAFVLVPLLGRWGVPLFAATLGVCCFGAAVEIALSTAYMLAQTFGWNWDEDEKPHREARFATTYSLMFAGAALLTTTGIDPLRLTMYVMAITAAILPLVVVPFLLLLNDQTYVKDHRNGPIGNAVVILTIALSSIVAVVAIPLEFFGG
jgi:Mn2+/Fe2+ NRAMP family transporter